MKQQKHSGSLDIRSLRRISQKKSYFKQFDIIRCVNFCTPWYIFFLILFFEISRNKTFREKYWKRKNLFQIMSLSIVNSGVEAKLKRNNARIVFHKNC